MLSWTLLWSQIFKIHPWLLIKNLGVSLWHRSTSNWESSLIIPKKFQKSRKIQNNRKWYFELNDLNPTIKIIKSLPDTSIDIRILGTEGYSFIDTPKRQISQVALQLIWMISKLVDIYRRQDMDKLMTTFYPSSETKRWFETYWSS